MDALIAAAARALSAGDPLVALKRIALRDDAPALALRGIAMAQLGTVLRTIETDRFVTGVTWVDGELWHGTWEGGESDVRRIHPETGEVLERLDMPAGTGVSGLESDGGDRFFCGGGSSGKVRAIRRPKPGLSPRA